MANTENAAKIKENDGGEVAIDKNYLTNSKLEKTMLLLKVPLICCKKGKMKQCQLSPNSDNSYMFRVKSIKYTIMLLIEAI